jgi:hypothetical protein
MEDRASREAHKKFGVLLGHRTQVHQNIAPLPVDLSDCASVSVGAGTDDAEEGFSGPQTSAQHSPGPFR